MQQVSMVEKRMRRVRPRDAALASRSRGGEEEARRGVARVLSSDEISRDVRIDVHAHRARARTVQRVQQMPMVGGRVRQVRPGDAAFTARSRGEKDDQDEDQGGEVEEIGAGGG